MNKKMITTVVIALFCLVVPFFLFAQRTEKSWGIVPIPIFLYTPETGICGGVYLVYYHNPNPNNPEQKQNMIVGMGFYTSKKQISLNANTEHYFKGNDFKLTTEVDFSLFPDIYYGIGSDADLEEDYTPRNIEFEGAFGWEVHKNMYLGPFYRLSFSKIVDTEANGELETGNLIGSKGTTISGGGVQLHWDERDSSIFPLEGFLLALRASLYRKEIGSKENYSKIELDYRHFFKIFRHHVFAFQYLMNLSAGEVPLGDLQELGGATMLRGYREGRYRDKNYAAFQGEYRFPIFWRFGGVLFGGVGQVAPAFDKFTFSDVKLAGGVGIRFTVGPREHINLGFDLAFSDQGYGFYINLMEAF